MTMQAHERIHFNGAKRSLLGFPMDQYWDAHPPRPYFADAGSALWRGYLGTWAILDEHLYLVALSEAEAYEMAGECLEPEEWKGLERMIGKELGNQPTLDNLTRFLRAPPSGSTAAIMRSARIAMSLIQSLGEGDKGVGADPVEALRRAVWNQRAKCLSGNLIPVTLETLFPNHKGRIFADWYTGTLSLSEGDPLESSGYVPEYESATELDIRAGKLIGQRLHRYAFQL